MKCRWCRTGNKSEKGLHVIDGARITCMGVKENVIENYLVEQTEAHGGEVRKVKWIGRRGAPDRRVMLPARGCWVECKRPGAKPEPHQEREHKRMRDAGEVVYVIDTHWQVDALMRGEL